MEPGFILAVISALCGVIAGVWGLAWSFSSKFSRGFEKIYSQIEKVEGNILNKLEYHERHDDERFSRLSDRVWELKVGMKTKNNGSHEAISRTSGA